MQVITFVTGLRWSLVLLLLAVMGVWSSHAPGDASPTDGGDAMDEEIHQQLRTIGNAMADAYRRGDEEAGKRLEAIYWPILAEYARRFRERHPLLDPRAEKRSWSVPTSCDPTMWPSIPAPTAVTTRAAFSDGKPRSSARFRAHGRAAADPSRTFPPGRQPRASTRA
jgi:hypothetical protein